MLTSSSSELQQSLREQLQSCAYPGYVYGYPHKKAYRPLSRSLSLADVWRDEDRRHLYCYVHVPFCNQRCSFCNLFTYVPTADSPTAGYCDALSREMDAYAEALGDFHFDRLYLGGGTPTFLDGNELRTLMRRLRDTLGVDPARSHGCIEASPETVDEEKIAALRELGFARVSLGVQSFVEAELQHVNRRFDFAQHGRAIEWIANAGFDHFNLDLIYGLPAQTMASWLHSLTRAIDSPANSLFLYPLYIRPLTGLARRTSLDSPIAPTTYQMAAMYDVAVSRLAEAGYRQVTMRQFRRLPVGNALRGVPEGAVGNALRGVPEGAVGNALRGVPAHTERHGGRSLQRSQSHTDEYSCQHHGMVGLGAGARSYTRALHYSTPWRMVARNIRAVVEDYTSRMQSGDSTVSFGHALDLDEQCRRFVIQSLLYDGLDTVAFAEAFGVRAQEQYADLWDALLAEACVVEEDGLIRLTTRGTRHADIVGQFFFSQRVARLIDEYEYDT